MRENGTLDYPYDIPIEPTYERQVAEDRNMIYYDHELEEKINADYYYNSLGGENSNGRGKESSSSSPPPPVAGDDDNNNNSDSSDNYNDKEEEENRFTNEDLLNLKAAVSLFLSVHTQDRDIMPNTYRTFEKLRDKINRLLLLLLLLLMSNTSGNINLE
jgi:hypothetical protein